MTDIHRFLLEQRRRLEIRGFVRHCAAVPFEPVKDHGVHALNLLQQFIEHLVAEVLGSSVNVRVAKLHNGLHRRSSVHGD